MKNTLQRIIGLLLCFYCMISVKPALAQKQANHWYFGVHAGLDFSSGAPVVVNNGQTQNNTTNIEGCATISDSAGQLLFYTDGETVYNRFHNIMPNGTAIGGGQSSSQSSVILPKPGDPSKYYIFTTDDFLNQLQNGLNYSIVDMCLDGGNGDVMPAFKNIHLLDTASEKLAVCRHSNGTDYWVVTQKHNTNIFYAYQLSASGISNTVASPAGPVHGDGTAVSSLGQMKISPDHSKIALVDGQGQYPFAEVLEFNNSNGSISNADTFLTVTFPGPWQMYYGISFSPNSRYVYIGCSGFIQGFMQYDFQTQQFYFIPAAGGMGMQLGPDRKIYCVMSGSPYSLSVINSPDSSGALVNYTANTINLNGATVTYGLPEFLDDFDYPNTSVNCALPVSAFTTSDQTICPGTCIDFTNLSINASSYQWIFSGGSPSSSTAADPQNICYNTPGNYYVTLISTNSNGTDLITLNNFITVFPQSPPQAILQSGDTLFSNTGFVNYQWYINGNYISGATDYFHVAQSSGDYNLICNDSNGCELEAVVYNVVAGVKSTDGKENLGLFPNPAEDKVTIHNSQGTRGTAVEISVYNMTGEKVWEEIQEPRVGNQDIFIDVLRLTPGMYWLEIASEEKKFRSIFIKE